MSTWLTIARKAEIDIPSSEVTDTLTKPVRNHFGSVVVGFCRGVRRPEGWDSRPATPAPETQASPTADPDRSAETAAPLELEELMPQRHAEARASEIALGSSPEGVDPLQWSAAIDRLRDAPCSHEVMAHVIGVGDGVVLDVRPDGAFLCRGKTRTPLVLVGGRHEQEVE